MSDSPASILFDINGSQIATVSGVDGVRLATDVDGSVGIDPANTGGLSLEATSSGIAQTLTSIDSKDFATETKLEAVRVLLASLDSKDYSTETTLSGLAETTTSLEAKDFATETKLEAVRALLESINSNGFATETTLSGIAQTTTSIDNKVATEVTLAAAKAVLDSLDAKDFATEVTLSGLAETATSISNLDFATETTASGINISLTDIRDTKGIKRIEDPLPAGENILGRLKITDGDNVVSVVEDIVAGLNRLAIEGKVSTVAPVPPAASTEVVLASDTPLIITTTDTTAYVIPDGETFYLQSLSAGAEGDPTEKGSKIEVLFDDGGTERLVSRIYVSGFTVFQSFNDISKARDGTIMIGNAGGTNRVLLRRIRLSGGAQEVDSELRGYVQ